MVCFFFICFFFHVCGGVAMRCEDRRYQFWNEDTLWFLWKCSSYFVLCCWWGCSLCNLWYKGFMIIIIMLSKATSVFLCLFSWFYRSVHFLFSFVDFLDCFYMYLGKVHMCNKLASRHVRVGLANPSEVPRCDICENAPGIIIYIVLFSLFCVRVWMV